MRFRFYTARGTIDTDTLALALSDHEADVGIVEFGKSFNSIHPQDIETMQQARNLANLLELAETVQVQRVG